MSRNKISYVFTLIGVLLIGGTIIGNYYRQYTEKKLYKAYLEMNLNNSVETILKEEKQDLENKENQISTKEKEELEENLPIDKNKILGKINIEKINVDLLVLEGSSDEIIKYGAGHMEGTAYPGEIGNCVIVGHRNYAFGSMFNRLGELEEGDEVVLQYKGATYPYEIQEMKIVEPNDFSVLESRENEELTLITCHPIYTGEKRLIIKGILNK